MNEISKHDSDEPQTELTPENPEQKIEKELSPEVVEKIMAKVQDINREGTAYTIMGDIGVNAVNMPLIERLKSVFKMGVLNKNWFFYEKEKEGGAIDLVEKEDIAKYKRRGEVYFNIVGRSAMSLPEVVGDTVQSPPEYPDKNEIKHTFTTNTVALIFDLEKYEPELKREYMAAKKMAESEHFKPDVNSVWGKPKKSRSYTYNGPLEYLARMIKQGIVTNNGLPKAGAEYGYTLQHRIPPRFFKGLVLKPEDDNYYLDKLLRGARETMQEAYKGKENLLIPIYDVNGNLLWPKQMSYEEVKKFVSERETKTKKSKQ